MEKSSIHVYPIPKIYLSTFILREMNSRKYACKLVYLTYTVSYRQRKLSSICSFDDESPLFGLDNSFGSEFSHRVLT